MPISVVVGGQFGSEGKGKVAHYLARELNAKAAIRVGGPNSGHTVISESGQALIFKQLPTAAILPDVQCVLPAGSYIYPPLLFEEMRLANLPTKRLWIDSNAVIITEREIAEERESGLRTAIGSTLSGTGAAVAKRIGRRDGVVLARNESSLSPFVKATTPLLNELLHAKERILIEGTQGFGLSALHSPHYPYATSRDTTAAAFVSEAGLSPLDVDDIVLVIRAFPIRVAGNSGPLPEESSWDEITQESGRKAQIIEYTSVTKAVRRVARFDPAIVRQAILFNKPTRIVLNHVDYIDADCAISTDHTERSNAFVLNIEAEIRSRVSHIGFGPNHLVENKTS